MKINRKIAAGIDPRVRQLGDQMMGYMADRQALLNSGTDVGLDAVFRLVRASLWRPLGAVSIFYANLADGPGSRIGGIRDSR
jgi:hypothetical protein